MFSKVLPSTVSLLREKIQHSFKDVNDESGEESVAGKIVIVTGASDSDVGKTVTRQLVKRGAIVIMTSENLINAANVADEIQLGNPNESHLDLIRLDLNDFSSIQDFCYKVQYKYPHVNILINASQVCHLTTSTEEPTTTKDGYEINMGYNYLGHVLLTQLLLNHIKKGAPSRIVFVSSFTHEWADLNIDNLMMENPTSLGFLNTTPFNNSQLCLILYSRYLSKRMRGARVNCYSLCPGTFSSTTLLSAEYYSQYQKYVVQGAKFLLASPAEKGSESILYCALSTDCLNETGKLYRFRKWWEEADKKLNLNYNETFEKKLWDATKKIIPSKYLTNNQK